ncbi:Ig-like domain-containing protein [Neobacillus sp. MER 74]|uniref:Ig-like domain-containing protein n=1 Tax=Neobacillus sp. MER 74 TaxID=2939566 RepID=UPI002041D4D8|nr:Ig-like domain-containing protein [Neobacillus sp. MER 74]MCM3118422.1 Ig-like domain-containing protein [Neobacillus sp. MER 74]
MRRIVVLLLVLQLLVLPWKGYAQGGEVVSPQLEKSLDAKVSVGKEPKQANEKEADYRDPSNYPLVAEGGGYIASLLDSYSNYQTIYYMDSTTSPYSSDDMKIRLLYSSQSSYTKDSILTIEYFKEEGNTLNYDFSSQFNTTGYSAVYLNSYLSKSDYANQPYIYMRIGVSRSYWDAYYAGVTTFKVVNPFYSGSAESDAAYAVISNESTNGDSTEPTGTFNFNSMKKSMDKSTKAGTYEIEVNKPFDIQSNKGKLVQKSTKSIQKSYNVGDSKYFWVSNLETNADYQISARLAYRGTKANVWVNNNQITDYDAQKLGEEFDHSIYSTVTNNFGVPSDVDGDGKVNILTYDIQDGFTGSGGYVAGYFWAGDLYNLTISNKSEIFYIDTYPTMGSSLTKDVTKAYDTLAHEFQHMVNFNENVLLEGSSNMDTWLNEGLSMAAEQIYSGSGLQDRVDYYNQSSSVQNGHSLLYWDDYGDTLSNYSLSYLFVQYVKQQANQGDRIFKEILTDKDNNYKAIEDVAKKYISPDMTFGKLMTNFRIALLLKESTGLYGFKGDPFFDSLQKKVFTGKSTNLRGGGSIVTTYNPTEGLAEPADKGQDVTYTLLGTDQGAGNVDQTPPDQPVVNGLSDVDTQITGNAEPNATVYAMVGQSEIGRTTSDSSGAFTMTIPLQSAGTMVNVYVSDAAGNVSEATTIVVTDATAPAKPLVNEVTDKDTIVTGQAEAESKIEVKVKGSVIGFGTTGEDGQYQVTISAQKAGIELVITATDKAGNVSETTAVEIKDATAPGKPVVSLVSDKDTTITGEAEAGSRIEVKVNGSVIATGTAGEDGKYKVTIRVQRAGTLLVIIATDAAGNESEGTTIKVIDKTAPSVLTVNTVSDKSKEVTGKTEAGATVSVKIGTKVYAAKADPIGNYKVIILAQKAGTKLVVTAKDAAGNISVAKSITVIDKTAPVTPTVYTVSTLSKVVTGKAEAGAIVTVTIGTKKYIAKADVKGNFKVTIPVQKAGTKVVVTAKDKAGNVSVAKSVIVIDKTAPAAPKIKTAVKSTTKEVTGTAEAYSTITIKVGKKVIGTAKTDSRGKFKVKIKAQKKKTVLSVTATDKAKNVSKAATVKVK